MISYTVSRRTSEIGIRMALGAQPGQVLRQVLAQGMVLTCLGLIMGLGVAIWAARTIETLLFGVKAGDPIAYVIAGLVLALVALVANLFPARKAAAVDPISALRFE